MSRGGRGAYDAVRAMMDQLMGEDRDLPPDQRSGRGRAFEDPEVDRAHLCGCSPFVVLANTKSESMLPPLDGPLVQDDKLKARWDALPQAEKDRYGFEHETLNLLRSLVDEMDRRIAALKARVEAAPEVPEAEICPPETSEALQGLKDQIEELQVRAEAAGDAGAIDESLALNEQAEALGRRKAELEAGVEARRAAALARRQVVCTVSGLQHAANDSEARVEELRQGRQYRGWKAIRDRLAELEAQRPPRGDPKYARRGAGRGPPGREAPRGPYGAGPREYGRPGPRSRSPDRDQDYGSRGPRDYRDFRGGPRDYRERDYGDPRDRGGRGYGRDYRGPPGPGPGRARDEYDRYGPPPRRY